MLLRARRAPTAADPTGQFCDSEFGSVAQLAAPCGAHLRYGQQHDVEAAHHEESDKTPCAVPRGELENAEGQRHIPTLKPECEQFVECHASGAYQ